MRFLMPSLYKFNLFETENRVGFLLRKCFQWVNLIKKVFYGMQNEYLIKYITNFINLIAFIFLIIKKSYKENITILYFLLNFLYKNTSILTFLKILIL